MINTPALENKYTASRNILFKTYCFRIIEENIEYVKHSLKL